MENNQIDTTSMFILVEDGNGMKHKHINFDNPEICPREGTIEIESMKKQDLERSLSNNAGFSMFKDNVTGIIWGIPTSIHNIGKYIQYKRIRLGNNTFFDRTIPEQAEVCAIILKAIEVGKFKDPKGRPRFKIRDKEKIARENIDLRGTKRKAMDVIESIPYGEELKDIARNMAINPDIYSPLVLADEISKVVEARPKEFLDMYNSPTRAYLTILKNAQSMGVIEFNPLEGFKYGGMLLGKTQEMAVTELSKKPDLAQSIDAFTRDKRSKSTIPGADSVLVKRLPTSGEKSAEVLDLEKRLAEAESKLAEKNLSTGDVDKKDEGDMEALRAEAKELGVKGWQVPKTTYKTLKAKVDAKKAELEVTQ
jgi:hypothetical protein